MAKSKMQSVKRRKVNARIQRPTVDRRDQLQTGTYQSHNERRLMMPPKKAITWGRKFYRSFLSFFGSFFHTGPGAISSLDLRGGGLFSSKPKRDAGACMLRSWFPKLGKLVSTLDGKRV